MNRNHMSALFVAKVMPTKPNWKVIKWMFTSDPDLLNVGLMSNVVRISTNWPTVMLMKKMSINLITEQWNHSRIIQKSFLNYSIMNYYRAWDNKDTYLLTYLSRFHGLLKKKKEFLQESKWEKNGSKIWMWCDYQNRT